MREWPKQTYQRADHKWIMGHSRIYYYEFFDHAAGVMHGVDVFDMDPNTFRLKREIVAERGQWSPALKTWAFENGWSCRFAGDSCSAYQSFSSEPGGLETRWHSDLTEPPDYFVTAAVDRQKSGADRRPMNGAATVDRPKSGAAAGRGSFGITPST